MDIIDSAINIHGAKKVYEAAYKRMQGDKKPLQNVELGANTMGDAWEIMQRAFNSLTPAERAADYWDVMQHDK